MPPDFGKRRREALRDVFSAILARAAQWPADAILIAGDLYEEDRVTRDTVAFLCDAFEGVRPIPVFIAPGNRDPYTPGSPYATEPWPENVRIFDQPEWRAEKPEDLALTVFGFGFDGALPTRNPFGALNVPADGRAHVAVAHGAERAAMPPGKATCAPFDAPEAVAAGLHYLALGHLHDTTSIEGPFETVAYYAGAPEGHGFSECGPRHFLEVELEQSADTWRASVRPVQSSRLVFSEIEVDCSTIASPEELIEEARARLAFAGSRQIARIKLEGTCPSACRGALPALRETLSETVAFLDVIDGTRSAEDHEALAGEEHALGSFVARMNAQIDEAPDERLRAMLERAREAGVAAYRGEELPIRGLEGLHR